MYAENFPYQSPGVIPIVANTAWIDPANNTPNLDVLTRIEECGINTIFLPISSSTFNDVKKLLQQTSLKIILSHGDLRAKKGEKPETENQIIDRITKILKYNKILSYVIGWDIADEPTYDELAASGPGSLKYAYDCIHKDDEYNKFIFINLVGAPVGKFMNGKTYEQYVEIFQRNFTPAVFCFDLYPIFIQGGLRVSYDQFYYDLELFAKYSQTYKRPFWVYCQTAAWYSTSTDFYYPEIEEAYLRFAVFSALGYGAQGIVYFTYQQRLSNVSKGDTKINEYFYNAPINIEGDKTAAWYYLQRINQEISKYNDVFYECTPIKTINLYKSDLKDGKRSISIGPFKEVSFDRDGVQISQIENDGKKYIIVVNHDVQNYQSLNLKGHLDYKVSKITPDKNGDESYVSTSFIPNPGNGHNFELIPGGYIIFKYELWVPASK